MTDKEIVSALIAHAPSSDGAILFQGLSPTILERHKTGIWSTNH